MEDGPERELSEQQPSRSVVGFRDTVNCSSCLSAMRKVCMIAREAPVVLERARTDVKEQVEERERREDSLSLSLSLSLIITSNEYSTG
jgi:hypothetical protein